MYWKTSNQNVGICFVGVKKIITYQAKENIPSIKSLTSSCGCSRPSYNKETKILSVVFTPKPVPKHLVGKGQYETTKRIYVTYVNGARDTLVFSSLVKNKK